MNVENPRNMTGKSRQRRKKQNCTSGSVVNLMSNMANMFPTTGMVSRKN